MPDPEIREGQIWRDTYGEKPTRFGDAGRPNLRTIQITRVEPPSIEAKILTAVNGKPPASWRKTTSLSFRSLRQGYVLVQDAARIDHITAPPGAGGEP